MPMRVRVVGSCDKGPGESGDGRLGAILRRAGSGLCPESGTAYPMRARGWICPKYFLAVATFM